MSHDYPIGEADETIALHLVGWIVADPVRADRMLALTGIDPDALRNGLRDPAILGALMDFVIDHEPDLIACARAIEIAPAALVAARARIGQAGAQ